jgi:preprotein translocase subunit SecE
MPEIQAKAKTGLNKADKSKGKRMDGLKRFANDTKAEFKKIVWPAPKETLNQTVVVLLAIIIIGAFIWGLDSLTMFGLNSFLNKI